MDHTDFIDKINKSYDFANKFLHYGMEIRPKVTWVDGQAGRFIAEWLVTSDFIDQNQCIDEGVLGTVTDNTTAMLIGSVLCDRGKSVSTSISVQAVAPIKPNTVVEIVCAIASKTSKQPHATATFRDKQSPQKIYGRGAHTKFFKAGLSESQPRL